MGKSCVLDFSENMYYAQSQESGAFAKMKPLKKAYLEITNCCNLNCSFCHGTKREKKFMSPTEFGILAGKIRPYTEYLYLHVLGEPLLHPDLEAILKICEELHFKVTVTTNGTLLNQQEKTLLACKALYKVSVSLHAFEANNNMGNPEDYIVSVCAFAEKAAGKGVLCVMRLWNEGGENRFNSRICALLSDSFPGEHKENRNGVTLSRNIFLEFGERFQWPDKHAGIRNARFCMGLRDQIAVLCDGTVVPCCLDAEGDMPLGNLFRTDMDTILNSSRAQRIIDGFSDGKASEELCKRCDFAKRKFG